MGNYLDEKVKEFWGGFVVGGFAGVNFLFVDAVSWVDVATGYILRFIGVVMIAATSGVMTAMAVDFYKHKIKPKLFKNGNEEKDDQQKAA